MERAAVKNEIIEKLQQQILSLQGFKAPSEHHIALGLGPMETAFPNGIFPTGAIHEFLSTSGESAAATTGFMAGLLGKLMQQKGKCLWIATKRVLFPPSLKLFGIDPGKIIFIDLPSEKDVLWTIEEALKCDALAAVVGEVGEISFAQSRRLQLAVEQSRVTGLMHCLNPQKIGNTTAVARWQITPLASQLEEGMPGVGYARWQVDLLKIRNGRPGDWQLQWSRGRFQHLTKHRTSAPGIYLPQTG